MTTKKKTKKDAPKMTSVLDLSTVFINSEGKEQTFKVRKKGILGKLGFADTIKFTFAHALLSGFEKSTNYSGLKVAAKNQGLDDQMFIDFYNTAYNVVYGNNDDYITQITWNSELDIIPKMLVETMQVNRNISIKQAEQVINSIRQIERQEK